MNVHLPAPRRGWPARLAILAVVVVVLALASATFVLSYTGVHEIALQAGVSARLARIYPGVFDAVLVIACVAAVMLRDARWWARGYAWLVIIVVIGVVGAADAVHAMNVALPQRKTEGVVAAAPWVLVLLGFSLLLTMLRQSRDQHATAVAVPPTTTVQAARTADQPALPPAIAVERPTGLARHPAAPALPAAAMPTEHEAQPTPDAPDMPDLAGEPDHAERADRVSQVPFAGPRDDDHAPTLEVPAFAEPDEPPTASTAEFGGPSAADAPGAPSDENAELDAHAAEQEMTAEPAEEETEEETAAFRYTPAPAIWPTGDTIAEDGAGTDVAPRTRPVPGWIERVADSGDPPTQRHDYWDTDDDGGLRGTSSVPNGPGVPVEQDTPLRASSFTTVPRLNRVRATPIPPEEDEE